MKLHEYYNNTGTTGYSKLIPLDFNENNLTCITLSGVEYQVKEYSVLSATHQVHFYPFI